MSQEIKFVTLPELVEILKDVNRPMPATFVAATEVKMNKTDVETKKTPNPYHGRVVKRQKSNVFIKFDYENSVNKARLKEGKDADFVAKPRAWGVHVDNTPLIEHKGEFYLEARFLGNEPLIEYFIDKGTPIDKKLFEAFCPEKPESKTQDLENEVVIRDFKISGILEITMNGFRYIRTDV